MDVQHIGATVFQQARLVQFLGYTYACTDDNFGKSAAVSVGLLIVRLIAALR